MFGFRLPGNANNMIKLKGAVKNIPTPMRRNELTRVNQKINIGEGDAGIQ